MISRRGFLAAITAAPLLTSPAFATIPYGINITDPAYGPPAVGDGVTDDTAAIQARITAVGRGGTVLIPTPPAKYIIDGPGLLASGGVRLIGDSPLTAVLWRNTDGPVINFDANAWDAELANLNIQGCRTSPTQHAVVVGPNALVNMRDSNIWGGKAALYDQGVDGLRDNLNIAGMVYQMIVAGSNWWRRIKADGVFTGTGYGMIVTPGAGENHFDMCDFTGAFPGGAILAQAGGGSAALDFSGCVTGADVILQGFKWANFRGHEFAGGTFATAFPNATAISSSVAWTPISAPGVHDGGGNFNITF